MSAFFCKAIVTDPQSAAQNEIFRKIVITILLISSTLIAGRLQYSCTKAAKKLFDRRGEVRPTTKNSVVKVAWSLAHSQRKTNEGFWSR